MKYLKNFIVLSIYVVCSILIGKISVYFFSRFSEIKYAVFSSDNFFPGILITYLFFLVLISFVILVGSKRIKISNKIFSYLICCIIMISLLYIGAFRFIYMPDFEPFELVYIANDAAMYGAAMGLLCLVVRPECINGIAHWKLLP